MFDIIFLCIPGCINKPTEDTYNFKIGADDLKAISCALSVLPSYDFLGDISYELASTALRI